MASSRRRTWRSYRHREIGVTPPPQRGPPAPPRTTASSRYRPCSWRLRRPLWLATVPQRPYGLQSPHSATASCQRGLWHLLPVGLGPTTPSLYPSCPETPPDICPPLWHRDPVAFLLSPCGHSSQPNVRASSLPRH